MSEPPRSDEELPFQPAAWPEPEGFLPADPDEPPPIELWNAVGDVTPWGTVLLLLSWGVSAIRVSAAATASATNALIAHGASITTASGTEAAWRLLASTFLHSGISHLFFNAVTLLVLGQAVERVFSRWGFWIVAGWGGAAASLASLAWRLERDTALLSLSVGGSGIVFAMGGALLSGAFRLRDRLAPTRARALAASVLFLALPGFASGFERPTTDNAAHAAGLIAGLVLGSLLPVSTRLAGGPAGGLARAAGMLAAAALVYAFARVMLG